MQDDGIQGVLSRRFNNNIIASDPASSDGIHDHMESAAHVSHLMQMPSDDHGGHHHLHHSLADPHGPPNAMMANQMPEPAQLVVEGQLMRLLAQSPDGTLMCCASDTQLKFVDSRFMKLYETNTPGSITAACFHPHKYELFLKIDHRTLVFDLATKEYRQPEESDNMIPPEPWQPPPPPPNGAGVAGGMGGMGIGLNEKRRSGSGRPKGSKDKTQRKPRSAAAQQEFEKDVIAQLTAFCGEDASKWNAKKPAIDAVKASPMWDTWTKSGLNEQQLVQFVHRLKSAHGKRGGGGGGGGGGGRDPGGGGGGGGRLDMGMMHSHHQGAGSMGMPHLQPGFLSAMPLPSHAHLPPHHHLASHYPGNMGRGPM